MDSEFSFKIPKKKEPEASIFTAKPSFNPFVNSGSSTNPFKSLAQKENKVSEQPSSSDSKNDQKKPFFSGKLDPFFKGINHAAGIAPISKGHNPSEKKEGSFIKHRPTIAKPAVINTWIASKAEKDEPQKSSLPLSDKTTNHDGPQSARLAIRLEKPPKTRRNEIPVSRPKLQPPEKFLHTKRNLTESKPCNVTNIRPRIGGNYVTQEMDSILHALNDLNKRQCSDDYSRMIILDERDKLLYKWRAEIDKNSHFVGKKTVAGTLNSMCAEKERYMRCVQKRIASYECDKNGVVDSSRLVKEYSRSAADQEKPLPHELRHPAMLRYTMNYLLTKILDAFDPTSDELGGWYNFLWDRTRAIRKEITQLMLSNELAVSLLECCTRFHIICSYLLCSQDLDKFDQKMNTENLGKCLQTLRHLYEDLAKKGIYCSTESEFRSYDVLLHLHDSNVLRQVLSYRKDVRDSKAVRLSIQLASAMQTNNFAKFFRLLRLEANFLQCCVCHRFFAQVRKKALKTMSLSYGRNPSFNIRRLSLLLAFDDEVNALNILGEYGIYTNDMNTEEVDFTREHLNTDGEAPPVTFKWINSKNSYRLSETVNGGPVEHSHSLPEVIDSFDENGCYTQDPVVKNFLREHTDIRNETTHIEPIKISEEKSDHLKAAQKALEDERKRRLQEELEKKTLEEQKLHQQREEERRRQEYERRQMDEKQRQIELQRREQEELKMQFVKRQLLNLIPKLCHVIETEATEKLLKDVAVETMMCSREERRNCLGMIQRTCIDLITSTADCELKSIIKTVLRVRKKEVENVLSGVRNRLSLLWLRQFWDHWRSQVEIRKAARKRRSNAWQDFIPNWNSSTFSPNSYINSPHFTASVKRLKVDTEQLISLSELRRKRRLRLSKQVFDHWRSYAREKMHKRKQTKLILNASRNSVLIRKYDSERFADAKHWDRFNDRSPIRKSVKLSTAETFSFPIVPRSNLINYDAEDSFVPSFFENSIIAEEDVAIARKELQRSSIISQTNFGWKTKHATRKDAADGEESKKDTMELINECRLVQQRSQDLRKRADDLAGSMREHQSLINSVLKQATSKNNSY